MENNRIVNELQSRRIKSIRLLEETASAIEGEPMLVISENIFKQELQSAFALDNVLRIGKEITDDELAEINAAALKEAEQALETHKRMTKLSRAAFENYTGEN